MLKEGRLNLLALGETNLSSNEKCVWNEIHGDVGGRVKGVAALLCEEWYKATDGCECVNARTMRVKRSFLWRNCVQPLCTDPEW